jgi:hypothetical protein
VSIGAYVTGTGATRGRPLPERANVAYAPDLDVNGDTHYVYVSLFGRGLWYLADYSR